MAVSGLSAVTRPFSFKFFNVYDSADRADGRRVKRNLNGTETWQIYGLGGELLAEYAANASPAGPQKEYGYRNGQLLVTATVTTGSGSAPVLHDNPLLVGETTVQSRHITELLKGAKYFKRRRLMSKSLQLLT